MRKPNDGINEVKLILLLVGAYFTTGHIEAILRVMCYKLCKDVHIYVPVHAIYMSAMTKNLPLVRWYSPIGNVMKTTNVQI